MKPSVSVGHTSLPSRFENAVKSPSDMSCATTARPPSRIRIAIASGASVLRIGLELDPHLGGLHVLVEQSLAARDEAGAAHLLEAVGLDDLDRAEDSSSWMRADSRPGSAWTSRVVPVRSRLDSAWPTTKINGYGRIDTSATKGSREIIIVSTVANDVTALTRWSSPAPHIARTVWTSLVSRDITSPVGWSR